MIASNYTGIVLNSDINCPSYTLYNIMEAYIPVATRIYGILYGISKGCHKGQHNILCEGQLSSWFIFVCDSMPKC